MLKCDTTLLKSHFGMGVLLKICCIFSERLFLKTQGLLLYCAISTSIAKKTREMINVSTIAVIHYFS